jgi:hypothetical protein
VQDHIVLPPQRLLLAIVAHKVVVMVVVGIVAVLVADFFTKAVVLHRVLGFVFFGWHGGGSIKLVEMHLLHGHFALHQQFE